MPSTDVESVHSQRIMEAYIDPNYESKPIPNVSPSPISIPVEKGNNSGDYHGFSISIPKPKAPRGSIQDSINDHKKQKSVKSNMTSLRQPSSEDVHIIDGPLSEFMLELVKANSDHNLPPLDQLDMMQSFEMIKRSISAKPDTIPSTKQAEVVISSDEYQIATPALHENEDGYDAETENENDNEIQVIQYSPAINCINFFRNPRANTDK